MIQNASDQRMSLPYLVCIRVWAGEPPYQARLEVTYKINEQQVHTGWSFKHTHFILKVSSVLDVQHRDSTQHVVVNCVKPRLAWARVLIL